MSYQGTNSETGLLWPVFCFSEEADMKWRITNIVLAIVVLGLSGTGLAQAAPETKYIRDDATGGDCTSIGMWDLSTKTCTLTMDLSHSIAIVGDGITLDGNGHTVTDSDVCIDFSYIGGSSGSNETIKNLTMIQCGVGVFTELPNTTVTNSLFYDNGTAFAARGTLSFAIAKSVLSNNGTGIRLGGHLAGGLIANNTIANNGCGICFGVMSVNGVTIIDNIVSRNDYGISITGMGNVVKNNTISHNLTTGIRVIDWGGWGGIYNNNFIDNPSPQIETNTFSFPVVFNLDVPIGETIGANITLLLKDATT